MDHTNVLLRRADIARIFERDPRVAGFEQHREHFAPEIRGGHRFMQRQITAGGFLFVANVGFFKGDADFVVQVWAV